MKKIIIVLDSAAGISKKEAEEIGCVVVPLLITENSNITYKDSVDLNSKELIEKLNNNQILTTSQSLFGEALIKTEELIKNYDRVIIIPMSSKLSGNINMWRKVKDEIGSSNIHVVDALQLAYGIITLAKSVQELYKNNENATFSDIDKLAKAQLENFDGIICCTNFKQLVKGGRISSFKGNMGSILKLKVLVEFCNGELKFIEKVHSTKKAIMRMKEIIFKNLQIKSLDEINFIVYMSTFTENEKDQKKDLEIKQMLQKLFKNKLKIEQRDLPGVITCHVGINAFSLIVEKKI